MRFQPPPRHDPTETTNEPEKPSLEAEYLQRLAQEKTPVVLRLRTGETFQGYIEYYDKRFIRLTRREAPNLFIFKQDIQYLYEE